MTHPASKHGMNWIRKNKRLAIYLRDGLQCPFCHRGVEDGVVFTLDHVIPHSHGGGNEAGNLVTCCRRCNSSRGNQPIAQFVEANCADPTAVMAYILGRLAEDLSSYRAQANEILAQRRTFAGAIVEANELTC